MQETEMRTDTDVTPWYRQFWPWFIIALPTIIVVACIVMLMVAIEHDDSTVDDNYYKEGLAINMRLAEDQAATRLGLNAQLRLDLTSGDANLTLSSEQSVTPPASLLLRFTHPLNADADFEVNMRQIAGFSYRGDLERPIQGRWHLELRSEEWRLRKTIDVRPTANQVHQWDLVHE